MTTQEFEILNAKIDQLAKGVPFEHVIWDTGDIAKHLKLSYAYTRDHIITQPSFPRPIKEASGRAPATYYAIKVVSWIEKNYRLKS